MATRLRVVRRGFNYPADAESLALVRAGGGASKLTPEQRARVRWRQVGIGDFCDDMPPESAAIYLSRGDIEVVTVDDPVPAATRRVKE
jgi:hypothetical protein